MRIGWIQINPVVGDLRGNARRILNAWKEAAEMGAELVITPELALVGYPPQDLLFQSDFLPAADKVLAELSEEIHGVPLLVGTAAKNPSEAGKPFLNTAVLLDDGARKASVIKSLLPTYDVFDEARYFEPGTVRAPLEISGKRVGVTICEDLWTEEYLPRPLYPLDPVAELVKAGAQIVVNLSASPFEAGKPMKRLCMAGALAKEHGVPLVYCNAIGGNDQLVFDGHSFALNGRAELIGGPVGFRRDVRVVDTDNPGRVWEISENSKVEGIVSRTEELKQALVLGLRDYVQKCGFQSVVLGLSGGIDSAVTAALAVEALGPEKVLGVAMPGPYSSEGSVTDALALAEFLGIPCLQVPIRKPYETMLEGLTPFLQGRAADATEENLQARLRGITLMALSNKLGHLLLTTGNKSELAVGYCTLYGDMCGGLAVISDVSKTDVYALARWMNEQALAKHGRLIIPESTIEKPPSAELRPDQKDQDSLPPYEILDAILERYVEWDLGVSGIIKDGFDAETVRWVTRKVDLNEYKRKQAAPGLKMSRRAFGQGRRMPVAQRFLNEI